MGILERISHAGLEGIKVGRFKGGLTSSCIVYRLGDTVIDTGPPNQWAFVRRFLEERAIGHVLVTHHHEDHSGNGARIQRDLGRRVQAPPGAIEPLRRGFRMVLAQKVTWGRPVRFEAEPLAGDLRVGDGARLVPVPAPGHSADMTCYLEPDRGWLFSGDVYIASKPKYFRYDEDFGDQVASLRKLLAADFETLICSHRGVLPDGKGAIRAKLQYLEDLEGRIRALHAAGRSAREVRRFLLGREDGFTLFSFGAFSKQHMVDSALRRRVG